MHVLQQTNTRGKDLTTTTITLLEKQKDLVHLKAVTAHGSADNRATR
jgi:hypothetical protein